MEDLDFLTTYLSPRQIKKLNKQSKKEKTIVQTKYLRGSQQISEDNSVTINIKELVAKTENQQKLIDSLETKTQVVVFGPQGTGKTFVESAFAARLFLQRKIEKIVITRPNTGCGKTLGLFPGSVEDKMLVWCQPVVQVLKQYLGEGLFELALKRGQIVLQSLETIRGMDFQNSFVIVDESQNITVEEIKALVTRVGENSTLVFNGDMKQIDIKEQSGLQFLLNAIGKNKILQNYSSVIEFTTDDIVRSNLCKAWVEYFYNNEVA
jgi:phosphate starvation-inducible PhoH-like protein